LFIAAATNSSSIKYSKHNMQQNKQRKKEKPNYTFTEKSLNLLVFAANRLAYQMKNIADSIFVYYLNISGKGRKPLTCR